MGIYSFTDDRNEIPAGAKLVSVSDARSSMGSEVYGPRPMWVYETHIGVCLFERESNGYHDSDFYMTYWDEAKQEPVTVMFATTRGWTYPCMGSHADATPEVWAKYNAWSEKKQAERKQQIRNEKAKLLRNINREICKVSKELGVSPTRLLMLYRTLTKEQFEGVMKLLTSKLRSNFRISMKKQVVEWLKAQQIKYMKPLSPKQMEYI